MNRALIEYKFKNKDIIIKDKNNIKIKSLSLDDFEAAFNRTFSWEVGMPTYGELVLELFGVELCYERRNKEYLDRIREKIKKVTD